MQTLYTTASEIENARPKSLESEEQSTTSNEINTACAKPASTRFNALKRHENTRADLKCRKIANRVRKRQNALKSSKNHTNDSKTTKISKITQCVPQVSRKCPGSVPHVSRMCPACVPHVSRKCPASVPELHFALLRKLDDFKRKRTK